MDAITGEMIDEAALAHTGTSWGLAGTDLTGVLDPWQIVLSRQADGGAAPAALARMIAGLEESARTLADTARSRTDEFDRAERVLLETARVRSS